jgi:hypothetical protein
MSASIRMQKCLFIIFTALFNSCFMIRKACCNEGSDTYSATIETEVYDENATVNVKSLNSNYNGSLTEGLDGFIVEKYSFPVIIIIGTISNSLTFLVMRRKKMRHQSTYFYMAVLAIGIFFIFIFHLFNFLIRIKKKFFKFSKRMNWYY